MNNQMTMAEVPVALRAVVEIGEVACLIGASGIGKTQVTAQVAEEMDCDFVPINLMTKDPVELGGMPVLDTKTNSVSWVPVKVFLAGKRRKWFFFDEITHATPVVQSLCYQICEARMIGDHKLPDDCIITAAHNRSQDKGIHNRVPMPLRRRWFEIQCVVDDSPPAIDAWCRWANSNNVEPIVMAFVRLFPKMLYQDSVQDGLAPDPRSWVKISQLITNNHLSDNARHKLYAGKVGESAAVEFSSFERTFGDLPSIDAIFLNPATAQLPNGPAAMYAVASAVAKRIDVKNVGRGFTYLDRLPEEYNIFGVKLAHRNCSGIEHTPAFTKWSIKYSHVTF